MKSAPKKSENLNLFAKEKQFIQIALKRSGGKKVAAAKLLGIDRRSLYNKMKTYNID